MQIILEAPPLKTGDRKELCRLHNTVLQHIRALKAIECESSGPFITSVIELKLDTTTMFEWQKHSQVATSVPHYQELLDFINLRAQASEISTTKSPKGELKKNFHVGKPHLLLPPLTTLKRRYMPYVNQRSICYLIVWSSKNSHMRISFQYWKLITNVTIVSELGHYARHCKSVHCCKKCHGQHHTLLHYDPSKDNSIRNQQPNPVNSHATTGLRSQSLLMTYRVLIHSFEGSCVVARALLDSASSASFISDQLSQSQSVPSLVSLQHNNYRYGWNVSQFTYQR